MHTHMFCVHATSFIIQRYKWNHSAPRSDVMNQRRLNGWCGRVRHAPSSAIPQMIVAQITPTDVIFN